MTGNKLPIINKMPIIHGAVLFNQDNKMDNPMQHYRIGKVQQKLRTELSCQEVKYQYERRMMRSYKEKPERICTLLPRKKDCKDKIKIYAKDAPVRGLLPEWEEAMLSTIPQKLRKRFSELLDGQMAEVKERYLETMQKLSLITILKIDDDGCGDFELYSDPHYKLKGRTKNHWKFLKRRDAMEKIFFLSHKLAKTLLSKSVTKLPKFIIDFEKYRSLGYVEFLKFIETIDEDMKTGTFAIIRNYHADITTLVSPPVRIYRNVNQTYLPRFFRCCDRYLSLKIHETIKSTMERLLEVMDDPIKSPMIALTLKCEDHDLFVSPLIAAVKETFHSFLDHIGLLVRSLPSIEAIVRLPHARNACLATFPEWQLDDYHNRLSTILEKAYEPVEIYVSMMQEKFKGIFNAESQRKQVAMIVRNEDFDTCLEKLEEFDRFTVDIHTLTENEYFKNCKLYQEDAKANLKQYAGDVRKQIVKELVLRHQNFNSEICSQFEAIVERVSNIPTETREFLELSRYMIHVQTVELEELRERMGQSMQMLNSLFELTKLKKSHLTLNSRTINWFDKIEYILIKNGQLLEQKKFELEERLQSKIAELKKPILEMFPNLSFIDDMDDSDRVSEYIEHMRSFAREIERLDRKIEWINSEEELFNFPISTYPAVSELRNEIILPFYNLIYRGYQWQRDFNVWMDGPFEHLDSTVVESKTGEYLVDFSKIAKTYRAKIKMQSGSVGLFTFKGSIDDPDPLNQPAPTKLCHFFVQKVKWFKHYVGMVTCFCNPALVQRHWDEMSGIAGFDLTPDAGTTLRKMIKMDLLEKMDLYDQISVGATKELGLKNLLEKMKMEWDDVSFASTPYKDSKVNILTAVEDVHVMLEEHLIKVQSMRGSAFVKPISEEVQKFYHLLLRMQSTLEEWIKVQMQWMYLLPIFSSKDIVAQLPEEGIMFAEVDNTFRNVMTSANREPKVQLTAAAPGLLESLIKANELMERVNEGVLNYLEKKRLFFPRFFFLSNEDMLEILSETKDPLRVQPHLKKCFEGIWRLGFTEKLEIHSMIGDDKEEVFLQQPISTAAARGCVELWLAQVEEQMVLSVKEEVLMSYRDYDVNERVDWVRTWPGMVVLCVSQIYWSMQVQAALMTHIVSAMSELHRKLEDQIVDLVNLVKGQLSRQYRTLLNALITIDVHAKDVVKSLIDKRIIHETDFEWLAQLRYYWEDNVVVRIINASVNYAYEYLGNCPRLVITPLTDRCYRTLIGAYSLHLNGAPEGPAGTGKTETTKDLARALAVQCVVFNCSDGLDYKNMGKFFKGLASSGAWACFDEFNRIELEVLSVVAQQILSIIQAVRAGLETFVFEGTELNLKPTCYVCITMNPGYAGRSELPDNLKVLFRTVAMMVPDYAMIGEIFLYSSGFTDARSLSVKIVTTYKLCSEQLSSQFHYDYGMRAVKTVLTAAQNIKLRLPNELESVLMLRSIVDVNLPKFLDHDVPLFQGIISDLFPGIELPSPSYDALVKAVGEVCSRRNLQMTSGFLLKVIQTYEMMLVRHGFMLVGDPCGGKTTVLRVIADSLALLHEWGDEQVGAPTEYTTINPKSITMGQLYGQFDPVSAEWVDGVCAVAFRRYCSDESAARKWLIFDGPVDAVWIENLNTVLDDNKKLCLTSGEVMQMTSVMSMIFETMDLTQASPATVSRVGMIYVESQVLGWRPVVKSWLASSNPLWREDHEEMIEAMIDWLFEASLEFTRKKCTLTVHAGQINQVTSTLNVVEMLMNQAVANAQDPAQLTELNVAYWLQAAFLTGIIWGIGGTLDSASRQDFNAFLSNVWNNADPDHPLPDGFPDTIPIPSETLIHDNFYTYKGKGAWRYFGDTLKQMEIVECQSVTQTLVPTIDTVKYQYMFQLHIKQSKRFLLFGKTGTGKSFYIQNVMENKLSEDEILPNLVTFTSKTTAAQAQELVVSKLFKRRKGHYGPMGSARCVVFIDDVNMPAKEVYGAQPAIELLRQYFDHGIWYDLNEPTVLRIHDTMFVCAMAPPGGSRQEIYPRFLRHFNLYEISEFSRDSVSRIFNSIAQIGLLRNGFAKDVYPTVHNVVAATMAVFESAKAELLPTPLKSHYLFNLRDLARVVGGFVMVRKESVEGKERLARLWVHEILRVFGDRLVDDSDNKWLFDKIREVTDKVLKEPFDQLFADLPLYDGKLTPASLQHLIYGNFMDVDATAETRKYEEIASLEEYGRVADRYLEEHNLSSTKHADIVLFRYALEHLARICRILASPAGSLLMVGIGGSGRQSLTRLASSMLGCRAFQPEIGSAYGLTEWREDVKKVLKLAGGSGKDTVFLLTEGQIKDEAFLGDVDCLLNSGEVPNLFNVEEKQEVVEMTRLAAQGGNRNLDVSILTVLRYFVNRCKEKLHVMLCFSPIGQSFRTRLRMYPSLVSCCTIDWFQIWPEDALEQVAVRYMARIDVDEDVKIGSVTAFKYFQICAKEMSDRFYKERGRKTYVTSAAFLDLIRAFGLLMKEKQEATALAIERYVGGLEKLAFAAEQVGKMQTTLKRLQPELAKSASATAQTAKMIEKENVAVEKTTKIVKIEEDAANEQAQFAGALKTECESDLATALPVLDDAIAALNTLKPSDITLVKSMKNPPEGVKLVMAAVCVMLNVAADRVTDPTSGRIVLDYWSPSQRILSDLKFLDYLKEYDKENIAPATMKTIKKVYMTDSNFEPSKVAKAAKAAEGMCKWIRAMVLYDDINKIVKPKKVKLVEAENMFERTMNLLNEKRRVLADLNDKLERLKEQLAVTMKKKIELEDEVELCKNKLIRAEKLISGLGGEKSRWTQCSVDLKKSYACLPGDVLISCGMIAYLGPYVSSYRRESLEKWLAYVKDLNIPRSDNYDFNTVLGSEIKINAWNIHGLPRDSFSVENAIIMDNTKNYSLFIDPQSQANKWIRSMEKEHGLEIVKLTDATYMSTIEKCIELGKPVLIENVGEELDPALDPILAKNIYKVAGVWLITLGEQVIEYNEDFRLYITTKLRNPHYLPEVFNKVTLINFALTVEGLEDQLLGIVVAKERPDLQEKKEYLIIQGAANKKALKQVEDDILRTLSVSGASILEDEEAIQILDSSKTLSTDVTRKQEAAKETEIKIDAFRQNYRPIAKHSSALYYTVTELPNIDPMYQYSLVWFINLYEISIDSAKKSHVIERRLAFLRDTFTYNVYQNVCRSLFEKDKLLYSFILCTTIEQANDKLPRDEVNFFVTGGLVLQANAEPNPSSQWLIEKSWEEIKRSSNLKAFGNLWKDFKDKKKNDKWKDFYDSAEPQNEKLPDPWQTNLTSFQKLIAMRMIRPDKVTHKMLQYVRETMDPRFVTPPSFDIARSYADSNCLIPLLFILSPGSDPMSALSKFAEKSDYSSKFFSISLGQGQGPIARGLIEQGQEEGNWVCLQNCHLAVSWMQELEKICENFDIDNTNINFRLWLTSYPSDKFPITVLQNGVKMTNEPPSGLKQNLMRSYLSEPVKDPEFFTGCPSKSRTFTRLLYGLCFFHAVVQERRNYGAQGWNIPYGFNESDFQISAQQLQIFINEYNDVPFKAIIYLTGECNYGGRVTDDRDRRCLTTILDDFYNVQVVENDNYTFYKTSQYALPTRYQYADYIKQIESIPSHPPPEVLGLNMNAGITRELDVTKNFFDSLALLQGGASTGDASKQDDIIIAMANEMYERLPQPFDLEEAQKLHPASYSESMNTVLIQEMERYNKLLREMKTSLGMLDKGVKGLIVMTPDLETMYNHVLAGKVPPSWKKASAYPSLKPLMNFVNDFLERLKFFRDWMENGKPAVFWISGFSFVHAFLTGAAQNYARKYKISIDLIDFDFEVLPKFDAAEPPEDGVYVRGLFLTGARWDLSSMHLIEAQPKVLYDPMPLIWIKPGLKADIKTSERYVCPLYITSERFGVLKTTGHSTNYVLDIWLDTKLPTSHWIKRGLALLCQLDD